VGLNFKEIGRTEKPKKLGLKATKLYSAKLINHDDDQSEQNELAALEVGLD
jgi:hypothetical protein